MKRELLKALTAVILLLMPNLNFGQAPNLGTASSFALFTAAGAFNNTGAGTTVTGDVGTNVGAFNAFPLGTLIGTRHVADALAAQAANDVALAYGSLSPLPCGITLVNPTLGNGQTLAPNVYCLGEAGTLNGELILDAGGNSNAVFIIKIGGAFAAGPDSKVILTGGANLCNVYWQINGEFSLATRAAFQGTVLVNGAIALAGNSTLMGRGLSTAGAISTADNVVVTLGLPPVASIITASGPTTFCAGGSVTLSGNMGGTWNTGPTPTSPSMMVTTSGNFFVTNSSGCQTVMSNQITVTVNPLPAANAGMSVSICAGASVMIGAPAVAGSTYSWIIVSGPAVAPPTGANPTVSPTATTTYRLTETITATGCQRSNDVTITVGAALSCTITGNDICGAGNTTQLCVIAATPATYAWIGPGIVGATNTQCITVNMAGMYSVMVTPGVGGCGASMCSKTVVVNPLPAATVGGPFNICVGASVMIGAPAVAGNTYSWTASVGPAPVGANPIVMPTVTTTYTLTETVTATGCQSMNAVTVTVNAAPACSIMGASTICPGTTTTLTALPASAPGAILTYMWNTMQTTQSITVGPGAYSVVITNASGCSSVCTKIVTIDPLAFAGLNTTICNGSSVMLGRAPIAGHTYLWTPATGLSSATIANPIASPSVTTTYTLTETITATGCQSTSSVTVFVNALTITGNGMICPGKSTELCAPPGFTSYLWNTGATTRCITVTASGTYFVTAGGCTTTFGKTVTVIVPGTCQCECK